MLHIAPISRRELIRRLKELGFEGPYHGGKHDFVRRPTDQLKLALPRSDARGREIGVEFQKRIPNEIGVSGKEWMSL